MVSYSETVFRVKASLTNFLHKDRICADMAKLRNSATTALRAILVSLFFAIASSLTMALRQDSPTTPPLTTTTTNSIVSRSVAIRVAATNAVAVLTLSPSAGATDAMVDAEYPGTAVARTLAARRRVAETASRSGFDGDWETVVRRNLLWCGGLRDLPNAAPGEGYTGHSFNDFNHVDLTCLIDAVADDENDGRVDERVTLGNRLGAGIRIASSPELGPGGSWTTCAVGCSATPPRDVAHAQFRSRIAFKLVWVPDNDPASRRRDAMFVLVDDDGALLAKGRPTGRLPYLEERTANYELVRGSKYARATDALVGTS